ncbi:MAG: 3-hydroxyacyl-CoA dehydrogenase NAD-binding domain-containing protein [Mariprofundaceae bacterium]
MAVKPVVQLKRDDRYARLTFSRGDKKLNVLDEQCLQELEACLDELEVDSPKVLVLQSELEGCFIAGADIHAIAALDHVDHGVKLAERGQCICQRIEQLSSVSIAVINGVCLGGGLELALACDYLVMSHAKKARVGLPEIKIGIHPGFGGCVRLPRRVGWRVATEMILSGRIITAKRAKHIGLVDLLCHAEQFESALEKLSAQGKCHRFSVFPGWFRLWPVRRLFFMWVEHKLRERFAALDLNESYPAVLATVKVLEGVLRLSEQQGYACEANSIGHLAVTTTCKNLIRVFFLGEALKHQTAVKKGQSKLATSQHIAVYGAGVMGSGIAWVMAKDSFVDLHDVSDVAISHGLKSIVKYSKYDSDRLQRIRPVLGDSGLSSASVVIEAVLEDLEVKKLLWADIESKVSQSTLLLSNTSSLSLTDQQNGMQYPERMAGLHFFNPAPKMPLVEIFAGSKTSQETLDSTAALAVRLGKLPVIVADQPGFLVNRCLMPLMTSALALLEKGQSMQHIDGVLKHFGLPMGAIELADRVGLDICLHVGEHLSGSLVSSNQFAMPTWFAKMVADGLLGEKSLGGFYVYQKGKCKGVNKVSMSYVRPDQVASHHEKEFDANLSVDDGGVLEAQDVLDACLIPMLLEALLCLEQGVVETPLYLDAALVYGIGFPAFRGGLLAYFAQRQRSQLIQSILGLGFEAPVNLAVLDEVG